MAWTLVYADRRIHGLTDEAQQQIRAALETIWTQGGGAWIDLTDDEGRPVQLAISPGVPIRLVGDKPDSDAS